MLDSRIENVRCDAVIMLTWSDWFKEMRSNRYHYASRFQRHVPVYFVQPDLPYDAVCVERTEFPNIHVVHVSRLYGKKQDDLLINFLRSKGIISPILWIYNFHFHKFISKIYSPLRIYHATEDYFSSDFYSGDSIQNLLVTLSKVDFVVAVSEGVAKNIRENISIKKEVRVVTNGCDFAFWNNVHGKYVRKNNVVLYQGGIHRKIDIDLLDKVISELVDFEFWFCGEVYFDDYSKWNSIVSKKNVKSFGKLPLNKVRRLSGIASIGIIPFVQNDWIVKRSFPLKAFEYLASGLKVVSVPIESLTEYSSCFSFAANSEQFCEKIRTLAHADESEDLSRNLNIAKSMDYEIKFGSVINLINQHKISGR